MSTALERLAADLTTPVPYPPPRTYKWTEEELAEWLETLPAEERGFIVATLAHDLQDAPELDVRYILQRYRKSRNAQKWGLAAEAVLAFYAGKALGKLS